MATQAQIEGILRISGVYSLISGAASITDTSNYASIGIASPNTVKILLYIQDSTGQLLYKNAGYDTADFTSPDLLPLAGTTTYSFTLPTEINGQYLTGQYTINMKVQVVQSGVTTNAAKSLYQNITATCNGIVPNVSGEVSYNTAQVSLVDSTNYKSYTSLTNILTLYPPAPSGQASQTLTANGSPATLLYEPAMGIYPYTGNWEWALQSDITYTDSITNASTTCRITKQGNFDVVQSQLCKVLCLLKKYRTDVYALSATNENGAARAKQTLLQAEGEYMLAFAAERCGRPQSEINIYINKIYEITGLDPDCDCGCNDGISQPLVPTSIINGADGTDGTIIYSGAGVPSNSVGIVGDYYIDTDTGDLYKKTGATTWTCLVSLIGATGATGATGAAGAAGANGSTIIASVYDNVATTTTTWETLASLATVPASAATNLTVDGDKLIIRGVLQSAAGGIGGINTPNTRILMNGSVTLTGYNFGFYANNIGQIQYEVEFIRIASDAAKIVAKIWQEITVIAGTRYQDGVKLTVVDTYGSLDFTSAVTFAIQGDSNTIGDITLKQADLTINKITV